MSCELNNIPRSYIHQRNRVLSTVLFKDVFPDIVLKPVLLQISFSLNCCAKIGRFLLVFPMIISNAIFQNGNKICYWKLN